MEINSDNEDIGLNGFDSYLNNIIRKSRMGKFSEICKSIGKSRSYLRFSEESCINKALEDLEYHDHTLAMLDLLHHKYTRIITLDNWISLHRCTADFLMLCSTEQIKYCPDVFCDVCHYFATQCLNSQLEMSAILPLTTAIKKITAGDQTYLTRVHADLVLVCLQAKCLKPLLPYIECDISIISVQCNLNGCETFLLYYYYGAIAFITMKKFKQALYFLEIVVSTPCQVVSYIMLEAYRKYILVSLILFEKFDNLPSCISAVVNKYFKSLCSPYIELTRSFEKYEITSFTANMNKYDEEFIKDNNFTLVQQVKEQLRVKRIKRMRNVFVNICLQDMVTYLNEESVEFVESKLQEMILNGEIVAEIDSQTNIVHFPSHNDVITECELNDLVNKQIEECIKMEKHISRIDNKIIKRESFYEQIIDKDIHHESF